MSKKKTEEKAEELEYPFSMIGKRYEHHNGIVYTVQDITNYHNDSEREERYPTTVVYFGENGKKWSRPLSSWERSFVEYIPEGDLK